MLGMLMNLPCAAVGVDRYWTVCLKVIGFRLWMSYPLLYVLTHWFLLVWLAE